MQPKQYKSEESFQSDIVRKFSELYPERRGQLFHVSNQRNHKLQAFKARSIGIFPGVSDLIYFEGDKIGETKIKAIELKLPNSSHKIEHIEQQIEWARILMSKGGKWRLCRTLDEAIGFIEGNPIKDLGLWVTDVEMLLSNNQRKKTVKF